MSNELPFPPELKAKTDRLLEGMAKEEKPAVVKHNWLYSVVPASVGGSTLLHPYLAGYCRSCDQGFSVPIPSDKNGLRITKMGVPKDGCVVPEGF